MMDDGACETVNSGDRVCQSINCDHKPAAHINYVCRESRTLE